MKKKTFLLLVAGVLFSCNNDDNPNPNLYLIGTWNLIEVLADTGDGNGTFQPVDSNQTIELKNQLLVLNFTSNKGCSQKFEKIN